ncbi:unnamed protein product [Peniophora sp. CBMAI 1063]|nr:unnamed protein product [Peniophora sp. CBMAI 1063]
MPSSIREAGAPFANADADIILRSSDNVDFRAHRVLLSITSPIFADMFKLPPGEAGADTGDEEKGGVCVVKLPEDEKSLRILLGYCYLALAPVVLSSLDDAVRAVMVADKYQLSRGRVFAMEKLKDFAKEDPERVYALGWKMDMADVARVGARATLVKPYTIGLPTMEKVGSLPSPALLKLFVYQGACIEAALGVLDLAWFQTDMLVLKTGSFCGRTPLGRIGVSQLMQQNWNGMSWCSITDPLKRCFDAIRAALRTHPCGDAIDAAKLLEISTGGLCDSCARYHIATIPAFAELLASQVENALAKVPLDISY